MDLQVIQVILSVKQIDEPALAPAISSSSSASTSVLRTSSTVSTEFCSVEDDYDNLKKLTETDGTSFYQTTTTKMSNTPVNILLTGDLISKFQQGDSVVCVVFVRFSLVFNVLWFFAQNCLLCPLLVFAVW